MTRTRPRIAALVALWAPPLALMAVIFALSAQPDLSTGLGTWDLIARKLVHMAEYALLCLLWWRPLRTVTDWRRALAAAALVALVYAGTDELHQSFVEGRNGTPVDVAIDAVGIAAAALLVTRRER